jgi:hypothetical protein
MESEEALLKVYGLTSNPFAGPWRGPLSPRAPDEDRYYARVEGFGRELPEIQSWSKRAENVDADSRPVVLIHGPKGCGRTSTAYLVAYLILQQRAIKRASPPPALTSSLVRILITDDSAFKPIRDGVHQFYTTLFKHKIDVRDRDRELFNEVRSKVLNAAEFQRLAVYQDLSSRLFLTRAEKGENIDILFMFEDIKNPEQLQYILDSFSESPLLILVTENMKLVRPLKEKFATGDLNGLSIQLDKMTPSEIEELIMHRWKACSLTPETTQHPFKGITSVLNTNWPIKTVSLFMQHVFSAHLEQLSRVLSPSPVNIDSGFISRSIIAFFGREDR